jgi:Galactose oxidase, central domain
MAACWWWAATNYVFAELFDPATERFTPLADAGGEKRIFHVAQRMADGSVAVLGGERGDGAGEPLTSVWRFDPTTQRFAAQAPLQSTRTAAPALRHRDGLMFVGGEAATGATLEPWYWSPTEQRSLAALPAPRAWHSVDRLRDGRAIVVGGEHAGRYASDILVHEPQ